jgi:lipoyl(octanoyl) transferase
MDNPARTLTVYDLGLVEYQDGLALQKAFALARRGRAVRDVLLLLEHPPVLTLGRGADLANVLAAPEVLEKRGIRLQETDRGGEVTFHGPGQLVGYPIVDLSPERCDVHAYVHDVEETMISVCSEAGVRAGRIEGWTGVWVGEKGKDARKIGAIGVHISRWVTTHGFALNVSTDLSNFELIVPCGIREAGVTSLEHELGRAPSMLAVKEAAGRALAARLGARLQRGRLNHRTVSVNLLRPANNSDGFEVLMLKRHPHRGGFWQPVTGTIERGEKPQACAVRELQEETGARAEVRPLGYSHSFLFGEPRPDRAPRIFQETGFWAVTAGDQPIRLDSREHSTSEWVSAEEAVKRAPFPGLKEGIRRSLKAARESAK